jgi:hypothetical protein
MLSSFGWLLGARPQISHSPFIENTHETHLSTFRRPSQENPWLFGSHEISWGTRRNKCPQSEGPRPHRGIAASISTGKLFLSATLLPRFRQEKGWVKPEFYRF